MVQRNPSIAAALKSRGSNGDNETSCASDTQTNKKLKLNKAATAGESDEKPIVWEAVRSLRSRSAIRHCELCDVSAKDNAVEYGCVDEGDPHSDKPIEAIWYCKKCGPSLFFSWSQHLMLLWLRSRGKQLVQTQFARWLPPPTSSLLSYDIVAIACIVGDETQLLS